MTELFSCADLDLARRIEAGHAHSATVSSEGVISQTMAGGWAIFHRVNSPVTQAIGIGLDGEVTADGLDQLEAFFHQRGSDAIIDLCMLADARLLGMLHERGYVVREFTNVLVRRLDPAETFVRLPPGVECEPVAQHEFRPWARLVMQGFAGQDDVPEEQIEMLATPNPKIEAFFGLSDGSRGGAAAMGVHAGLATFFGDATLLRSRGRGLQAALIRHRLQKAAQLGCDLATASVVPGGISHRNYERAGFQFVYGRVMIGRRPPEP